ncbi:MAG: serine protein kinase PrkA [Planctomycetaceae bacterium]|nr:serine protein kinase PrkA [Planctomycetota bacterium]NUN52594.1 serine protein kinase PrkA [Planctomycetaceae bacterium]
MDAREFLSDAGNRARESFERDRRLLTFDQYVDLALADPYALGRSAVQFAVDAIDHFGTREVPGIGGPVRRHALWDAAWSGGRGAVSGQEAVQERLVRVLRSAAEEGRLDRLVVLHGPNGSAKSSLVETLMLGAAHYSTLPEGALYRFHWIFPKRTEGEEGSLGFVALGRPKEEGNAGPPESYALLEPDALGARIPCELRDDPLLLLAPPARRQVLAEGAKRKPPRRTLRHLEEGDLCPKCRAIFDGLFAAYRGDLRRVLRHVQVERWFLHPRFRSGAVVVPPQQSVDAQVREVSAGGAAAGLPAVLQHVSLAEPSGDLVDANRGILEFSDFLKRPIELSKYLLSTTEKGTVPVGPFLAHLNMVMLATTNEHYLDAFKQSPDWTSFKARMELVSVPYLLEPAKEEPVYRTFLAAMAPGRHVAPHVVEALALFSVLTRLRRPDPSAYPEGVREVVASLAPVDKARLYATGEPPDALGEQARRALLAVLPDLRDEYRDEVDYEGRHGASAREIRSVLAAAAADSGAADCLSPRLVLGHLRALLREKTVYLFLRIEPQEGYHRAAEFADAAEAFARRRTLEDLQEALELVPAGEHERRFERYVAHAVAFTQGERVRNPVTGAAEPPDREVLEGVERLLAVKESPDAFRRNLVARIGAFGVEHPGTKPDLRALFPEIHRALREDYFRTMREKVRKMETHILAFGTPEFDRLEPARQEVVRRALANMERKFGYCPKCSREAVVEVRKLLAEG